MEIKLGGRLQAVADFVPEGAPAADIGTDHGYLAAYLIESGRVPHVYASDLNAGPCDAAHRTVQLTGLQEQITVRRGSGLEPLEPGEVSTVCIAGMGGQLMIDILDASPAVVKKLDTLVLQPQNAAPELRKWLYRHSWHIEDEALAVDEGRIYEIIQAKRGRRKAPDPILLQIGPILWAKKPALLRNHIESLLFLHKRVAAGMEKSEKARKSKKYKDCVRQIQELEQYLTW